MDGHSAAQGVMTVSPAYKFSILARFREALDGLIDGKRRGAGGTGRVEYEKMEYAFADRFDCSSCPDRGSDYSQAVKSVRANGNNLGNRVRYIYQSFQ